MSFSRPPIDYLSGLVHELCKLPAETSWLEFKHNKADPNMIGERISALSNSAALDGKSTAYLIWGVEDGSHRLVGTSFDPATAKVGNEALENWLRHSLTPSLHFSFHSINIEGLPVVVLEIPRATHAPIQFKGIEYIRSTSYTKSLKDFPEMERKLWQIFETTPFESLPATEEISPEEVLRLIDYPAYFDLMGMDLPTNRDQILARLKSENLIAITDSGKWRILNLGALLFAKSLADFRGLARKALRIIHYQGRTRIVTQHEQMGSKGYANGFEGLISHINARIPHNEVLGTALRKEVPMFPEMSIRELVANALIHQDFEMMTTQERVHACYLHSCLRYLLRDYMTNESLRERFGLAVEKSASISKIFTLAKKNGLIAPAEPNQSPKFARYLPHWAV